MSEAEAKTEEAKDKMLGDLLELTGLEAPSKEEEPAPKKEEVALQEFIESAAPEDKDPVVETPAPKVEQVALETQDPETPVPELTELDVANATIVRLTEALNKPLEVSSIPAVAPTPNLGVAPEMIVQQPVPTVAPTPDPPVQQSNLPVATELTQESFEQLMTQPQAFQAHLQETMNQVAQQVREQVLLEVGPLVDTKMNARVNVESQVKDFFSGPSNQDIVARNHAPRVVMQAELVEQANPNVPLVEVLQHSTNLVRRAVGLPEVNYTIPSVPNSSELIVPPQQAPPQAAPEKRFAAPTAKRQAAPATQEGDPIVNQIIGMAPVLNGINNLLI